MTNETHDMIEALHLAELTDDERLQSARDYALKCLRSKAPIPMTVLNIVEHGAQPSQQSKQSQQSDFPIIPIKESSA